MGQDLLKTPTTVESNATCGCLNTIKNIPRVSRVNMAMKIVNLYGSFTCRQNTIIQGDISLIFWLKLIDSYLIPL